MKTLACIFSIALSLNHWGAPLQANGNDEWPAFRGNPSLTGIADMELQDGYSLKWTFETDDFETASPVISNSKVFVGSQDGTFYALAADTGKPLWTFATSNTIESAATVVSNRVLVGSTDDTLYCLDTDTGTLVWQYVTEGPIHSAPNTFLTKSGRTLVIFGSHDASVYAVDLETGKKEWKYETDNFVNGTPAIYQKDVVFGGCDGLLHVLDAAKGTEKASIEIGAYIAGSAAIVKGVSYVGHYGNEVVAVDLDSQKLLWRFAKRDFAYFASPAVNEKYLIVGGRDKYVHCLSPKTGKQLWEFKALGAVDSSAVICGNRCIVGSNDGRLHILDVDSGESVWTYEIGEAVTSSPAVTPNLIVVGSEDGSVYGFEPR